MWPMSIEVTHACNPSLQEGDVGESCESQANLGFTVVQRSIGLHSETLSLKKLNTACTYSFIFKMCIENKRKILPLIETFRSILS